MHLFVPRGARAARRLTPRYINRLSVFPCQRPFSESVGILRSPSVGKCFKGRAQLLRNSAQGQYIGTKRNAHGSTSQLLDPTYSTFSKSK